MGRQKTIWIDEETWMKLEMMDGDSISGKIKRCIRSHDLAQEAMEDALRKQIALLKYTLIQNKIQGWWNDEHND